MPKSPSIVDINLIKQRINFVDKFINWVLSVGRALIIITEIIALTAFLYRFSLDRQLIDLHTKIQQEQTIVGFSKTSENTYRNLQDRIETAYQSAKLGSGNVKTLKDIINLAPNGFSFNTLTLYQDRVKIDASVGLISQLGTFVDSLRNYPTISNVSIDKIENMPSSYLITVSLTGFFKKK